MPNLNISLNLKRPTGLLNSSQLGSFAAQHLLAALQKAVSGTNQCDGIIYNVTDVETLGNIAYTGPAIAALVMAASSGAVGGTIGGTLITVAHDGSDTTSSTALAAAIRASATHNRKVTATNVSMRLTLATATAGQFVDICGVRFTAVAGAVAKFGDFSIDTSDTAAGTSLALAINRHPSTAMRYRAVSVAGTVYVFPTTARTLSPTVDKWVGLVNTGSFSTITISAPVPAVGVATAVLATVPGDIGNEVRLAASGTNVTAITNGSAGFLGNGTGGAVPYFELP
jgi:hypothetical protein